MELQQKIIAEVIKEHGRPTLKELSVLTGIQQTRLFRIMNGHSMKLAEYLRFQQCLNAETSSHYELQSTQKICHSFKLIKNYLEIIGEQGRRELDAMMAQKIRHLQIINAGGAR